MAETDMDMPDLEKQIAEHDKVLSALNCEIDRVLLSVEELTEQARAALDDYQRHKRSANVALGQASRGYIAAMRFFGRVDHLGSQLDVMKQQHVHLSLAVIHLASTDRDAAERLIPLVKGSRKRLKNLYENIERLRNEARLSDESEGQEATKPAATEGQSDSTFNSESVR
jgi:hypothetical protein